MELNIFMRELESALIKRGIPDETAMKHVSNLRRTFTSDDLSEIEAIQSNLEIEQLADSISAILNKSQKTAVQQPAAPARQSMPQSAPVSAPPVERQSQPVCEQPKPKPASREANRRDEYFEYSAEAANPSMKGMLLFWIGLFVLSPIWLGLLAAMLLLFVGLFVGLSALIVACIAVLIALVAVGAAVSLVGIVFGITQLFTFVAGGLYEIGLGIMIAGGVLFAAILIYNFAIRFLPWLITQLGTFLAFLCGKIKSLFLVIRRECYKL